MRKFLVISILLVISGNVYSYFFVPSLVTAFNTAVQASRIKNALPALGLTSGQKGAVALSASGVLAIGADSLISDVSNQRTPLPFSSSSRIVLTNFTGVRFSFYEYAFTGSYPVDPSTGLFLPYPLFSSMTLYKMKFEGTSITYSDGSRSFTDCVYSVDSVSNYNYSPPIYSSQASPSTPYVVSGSSGAISAFKEELSNISSQDYTCTPKFNEDYNTSQPYQSSVPIQTDGSGSFYIDSDTGETIPVYLIDLVEAGLAYQEATGSIYDFAEGLWNSMTSDSSVSVPVEFQGKTYTEATHLVNDFLGTNDPDILQNIDSLPSPSGVVPDSSVIPTDPVTTTQDTVKLDQILLSLDAFTNSSTFGSGVSSIVDSNLTGTQMIVNSIESFKQSSVSNSADLLASQSVLTDSIIAQELLTTGAVNDLTLSQNLTTEAVNNLTTAQGVTTLSINGLSENLTVLNTPVTDFSGITFSESLSRLYLGLNDSNFIVALSNVVPPSYASSPCPSLSISAFDGTASTTAHCDLVESNSTLMSVLFLALWSWIAFLVFMKA